MTIKCRNCGRKYSFETHETCPECGEYTKPNAKVKNQYSRLTKENIKDYEKEDETSRYKQKATRKEQQETRSFSNEDADSTKKKKGLGAFIAFIGIALTLVTNTMDLFSSDYEEVSTSEPVQEEIFLEEEVYFENIAETPLGTFEIIDIYPLVEGLSSNGNDIVAVELQHSSTVVQPENQVSEYLNYIALEYSNGEHVETVYSEDITYEILELYHQEIEYFEEYFVGTEDTLSGTLFFEIPQNVGEFDIVIDTTEYADALTTDRRYISTFAIQ